MNKKKIIPFALLALGLSLVACNNGTKTSSGTSDKELTILEKLESQIEGGNACVHVDNYADMTYIDKDTYINEYLGDYAYYYYNTGLAYVDGVGYCSFTQVEDDMGEKLNDYKLSNIQLPCNEKFDYSGILYTLKTLVSYDSGKTTIEDDVATVADEDYALNMARFAGVEYPYSELAEDVTISAIENGYEFTIGFDLTKSEESLEPFECSFQITDFGNAKHELFENYLKTYKAVGLTEGFGEYEEILAEEAEPKMVDYLKNNFEFSIASVATYSWRAGLYIYDYGCGDKLEAIKNDLIGLGYEYVPEYSYEGCYDFVIETTATTSDSVEYVSGKYEVVVSYDSNKSMAEMYDYPENVFPEGAVIINFYHENYAEPGAMEKAMENIEYYPGKTCPSFSFDGIAYYNGTVEDYGRFDTDLYFTFELESEDDATTLFGRFVDAFDADDMFTKAYDAKNEEGEPFFLVGVYAFEEYDGEDLINYCRVTFNLGIDEMFYGDTLIHCSYEVNHNYVAE